jgi:hypothetical protein
MRFHTTLSLLLIAAAAMGINAMGTGLYSSSSEPSSPTAAPKHKVRDLRARNQFVFEEAPALEGMAHGAAEAV